MNVAVSLLVWFAIIAGLLLAFFLVQLVYLAVVLSWGDQQTSGLAYYGRSPAERERFNHGPLWRIGVETNYIAQLPNELGVSRQLEGSQPVGLQPMSLPDAGDR